MQNVNVKGTETEKNLREAFAAEAQARVKYEYFASKARRDGYEQIADIFDETAKNANMRRSGLSFCGTARRRRRLPR